MNKSIVLNKLELYKDKPVELGILDVATMYGNIEGHWLFDGGDCIIHVQKNTSNHSYEIPALTQKTYPFIITQVHYDDISYVKSYIPVGKGQVDEYLGEFDVLGTSKSSDEIIKEIQSDSINKAQDPRSFQNVSEVAPGTNYGKFRPVVSTSIDGLPKYYDNMVNGNG